MKVKVLGVNYKIKFVNQEQLDKQADSHGMKGTFYGLCNPKDKIIHVLNDDEYLANQTLSHELWHAFFHEAGLDNYEFDETLINALAKLGHKHIEVYNKVLDNEKK